MNWLLLRGLGREQHHWGSFCSQLQSASEKYKVYCLDLPGFGSRAKMTSPLSVYKITDQLRVKWKSDLFTQNNQPWIIVGISLGGMVALDWVHRYAGDFKAALVINSSSSHSPIWQRLKPSALAQLIRILITKDKSKREYEILKMVSHTHSEGSEVHKSWTHLAESSPPLQLNFFAQLIAASQFKPPQSISVPLLFLNSLKDQMVHPRCGEKLAQHFNAPLKIHSTAGHDLPLDDPQWMIDQLRDFEENLFGK